MSLLSRLWTAGGTIQRRTAPAPVEGRDMSWAAYQALFSYGGSMYSTAPFRSFNGDYILGSSAPAHAVLDRRASVLGEARPTFQRYKQGKPTELFSTPELEVLKTPWAGGTFRQLICICESDVAAHGNSYWVRSGVELIRLDPEHVTVVAGAIEIDGVEIGKRLLGYVVQRNSGNGIVLEPGDVAHYRPGVSVCEPFRGESWLAAVAADASSDIELTRYKGNFLKNGAMPGLAVTYEPTVDMTQLEQFVGVFADKFTGAMNAGKVMHFLGGRDVKTVGATLDQLAFKAVQGAGETRIASAAGVPATVAGFSEGMQGSSLNAGNYTATRRLFADAKIRPLLGSFCEAFAAVVRVPADARLWYDDAGVSFFQEDVMDAAEIRSRDALTMESFIRSGYTPNSARDAVVEGDHRLLVHTGLVSVQLQPPGTTATPPSQGTPNDQPQD
jgi:phage portal protein BeeE